MNHPRLSPIFEIGVARSGTTILSLILDSHPNIAIPYESHFFIKYYKRIKEIDDNLQNLEARKKLVNEILNEKYVKEWDYTPTLDSIDLTICTNLSGSIRAIFESYARQHGKNIWGDKTPEYIRHINVLNDLFPDAKYIHLIRDGRDVALSLMKQWFGPNDFISALKFWKTEITIGRKMLSMLPKHQVFNLKMEDLAVAPENNIQKVCQFLEIEYTPEMLTSFNRKAACKVGDRIDKHHTGLSGFLDIKNVTKWDSILSAGDQAIAWEYAGDILRELNYPPGITNHWAKSIYKIKHRLYESWKWRVQKSHRY